MNNYTYDEIKIGQEEKFEKIITKDMEDSFRVITSDDNPMHKDDEYAKTISDNKYKKHIVFGMLTSSFLSTMAGVYMPGRYSLIHSVENIKLKEPVYVGDVISIKGIVKEKVDMVKLILLHVVMINQNDKVVLTADMKIIVQK